MALDATVGGASSNSYVTQAEANTYFAAGMHPKNATWTALDTGGKDELLISATMHIEMENIDGPKYDTSTTTGVPDQRLRFPRSADYVDSTLIIPVAAKEACYEQAIHLAEAGTSDTRATLQAQGVKRVRMGDVTEEYNRSGTGSALCNTSMQKLLNAGLIRLTGAFCD